MLHNGGMKRKIRKWLIGLFIFLMPLCLIGVGMASWSMAEIDEKTNIMVQASDVTTNKVSSISIHPNLASSSIRFDAEMDDASGSVTSSNEKESQLDIKLTGYITSPKGEWTSIKTSLSLSGTNSSTGETYQSIYNDLVNDGYIVHPTFDPLPNDGTYGTNNSKWTTSDLTSNTWRFEVASSFAYGSIFGNMNPSTFFDSDTFNGSKKGNEYSKIEIREMLNRLQELNGAKYVITMRVLTETNASKLILQSGGGTFVTTNSTSNIVYEGMMSGDWITFPEVYRSNYVTDYYYLSGFSSHSSNTSYQFEAGRSYDFATLLSTHGKQQGDSLTFLPHYTSTKTTLSVSCNTSGNPMTVNYAVAWYSSNAGTTTSSKNVSNNNSWTQSLNIGDVVSMSMSGNSNIKHYTVSGFKGVSSSTQYTKSAYFTVEKANPTITITPKGNISIAVNWTYATPSTGQVSGSKMSDDAAFTLVTTAETQWGDSSNAVSVSDGATFSLKNYHGISSFVVKDANGNAVSASGGSYTAEEGMSIDVTVAPAIEIKWSIKSSYDSSKNVTGPKLSIVYTNSGDAEGASSVNHDFSSSKNTENESGTLTVSTLDKVNITASKGGDSSASVSVTYTSSGSEVSNYSTIQRFTQGITIAVVGTYGDSCILPGTLITMADGTQKPVEEVTLRDQVMAYDFVSGSYVPREVIYYKESHDEDAYIVTVHFDDGSYLETSGGQSYFDMERREYFQIDDDSDEHIGKTVMSYDSGSMSSKTITKIETERRSTKVYELVTSYSYNFVANNVLTVEPLYFDSNVFEVGEDYRYDQAAMARDIALYGLYDYEKDFSPYCNEEQFEKYNLAYMKVAVGKGLLTFQDMVDAIERWQQYSI